MAMNELQQEIRRKRWNDILEQPSNRSRESKKLRWLQHETWALYETNYVTCSWQQKLGFELDAGGPFKSYFLCFQGKLI